MFTMRTPGSLFFSAIIGLMLSSACAGQDEPAEPLFDGALDRNEAIASLRAPRSPTVLSPTLAAEEFDRAVLNRLMQEIANKPDVTQTRLGVSAAELQDIFIAISNARNFINGSEMANIRAMCSAWDDSAASGEARIQVALDAYTRRAQFTRDFIAKYYDVVLRDIEFFLSDSSRASFTIYLNDRRRRMANAGAASWGGLVETLESGSETIEFHCRN